MDSLPVYYAPIRPSWQMLLGDAMVDVVVAVVFGFLATLILAVPIILLNLKPLGRALDPPDYEQTFYCTSMPETDTGLLRWAQAQRDIGLAQVSRDGSMVTLKYRVMIGDGTGPAVPTAYYGYQVANASIMRCHIRTSRKDRMQRLAAQPAVAWIVVSSFTASQVGILLTFAWGMRRKRGSGEETVDLFAGPIAPSIGLGLAMGVLAVLCGILWSALMNHTTGAQEENGGVFEMALSFPIWAKIAMILLGTVVAPIGEELFFRGYLFGRYAAAGKVWLGIFVTGVIFGAAHIQPLNFLLLAVMGMMLAWTYHRSGSLIASMTTHFVNNAFAFFLLFSTHHA